MTRSNRRRLTLAAVSMAAAASTALLSACGAGQVAATANIVAAIPGGAGDLVVDPSHPTEGQVSVRDAVVVFPESGAKYPAGTSAPLSLHLTNSSNRTVKLIGVTGKIFAPGDDVNAPGKDAGTITLASLAQPSPSPTPPASASALPSGSPSTKTSGSAKASAGATPSTPASPSAAPSPSAPAAPAQMSVTVPAAPAQPVTLEPGGSTDYLEITSLPVDLLPASQVSLYFTFTWTDDNGNTTTGYIGNTRSRAADASPRPVMAPVDPPATPMPRATLSLPATE